MLLLQTTPAPGHLLPILCIIQCRHTDNWFVLIFFGYLRIGSCIIIGYWHITVPILWMTKKYIFSNIGHLWQEHCWGYLADQVRVVLQYVVTQEKRNLPIHFSFFTLLDFNKCIYIFKLHFNIVHSQFIIKRYYPLFTFTDRIHSLFLTGCLV